MILVTGATGTVGREVVTQLLAAGERVRGMTRNPSTAQLDARVEVVKGDFAARETLAKAVEGVEQIFSLTFGPQTGTHERDLAGLAKKAGVRHIVKLSAMAGDGETKNVIREWHEQGEEAIKEAGISWTMVRPGGFMSNALHWSGTVRAEGKVLSNYGDGKLPSVHPRDIAAVVVRALTSDGHQRKTYHLTGPQALRVDEQVDILSEVLGRRIEYVRITDDVARKGMEKAGMPAFIIDALIPFAAFIRSGRAAQVLPTVEEVTGRPALTFIDWVRENAEEFRK